MKDKEILVPDEVKLNIFISDEEREKQDKEIFEKAKNAFKELGIEK